MNQSKFNMEAPKNWYQMLENIRAVRRMYPAPVDSMGCDQARGLKDTEINQRFQVLVSLMLSSQTKDPITWAAVQKLKNQGICNVDGLLNTQEKDIEDLIHPVGFYRRKAVYLRKVAAILKEKYNGDIPSSKESLCELPGVGPKMAHLCMQEAWGVNSGIGVDTHVHRISARLGWVPAKNVKTPEHTRIALESWLPRDYWREINHLLVGFGQTICTPLRPKCGECANNDICPSASLGMSVSSQTSGAAVKPKNEKGAAEAGPSFADSASSLPEIFTPVTIKTEPKLDKVTLKVEVDRKEAGVEPSTADQTDSTYSSLEDLGPSVTGPIKEEPDYHTYLSGSEKTENQPLERAKRGEKTKASVDTTEEQPRQKLRRSSRHLRPVIG